MRRNNHSIAPIFVENSGRFGKLEIIGLDYFLLKETLMNNSIHLRAGDASTVDYVFTAMMGKQ